MYNFLRNLKKIFCGQKLIVALGYRNIGPIKKGSGGSSVSIGGFKRQIRFLSLFGKFVSAENVRNFQNLKRVNFVMSFHQASHTLLELKPFLKKKEIPCVIIPNIRTSPELHGDRDMEYLSWEEIRREFLGDPLFTLGDEGTEPGALPSKAKEEIARDIRESGEIISNHLDKTPEIFSVSAGRLTQPFLVRVNEILWKNRYKTVLWSNGRASFVKSPLEHQMRYLPRIEAPASIPSLLSALAESIANAHQPIKDTVEPPSDKLKYNMEVSEDRDGALCFENINRQGRDYASDPAFYDYFFTRNPYHQRRGDYYKVSAEGDMECVRYKLYQPYSILGGQHVGITSAGWRKLRHTPGEASALPHFQIMKDEPIVGIYKPSGKTEKIYDFKIWKRVEVRRFEIPPGKPTGKNLSDHDIRETRAFPPELTGLCSEAASDFIFTRARTPEFYRWRIDGYPLLAEKPRYLVLYADNNSPAAFFVVQQNEATLAVADFHVPGSEEFTALFKHLKRLSSEIGLKRISVETSLPNIFQYLRRQAGASEETFHNYYYLNKKFPEIERIGGKLNEKWDSSTFHETMATGDILLRPVSML